MSYVSKPRPRDVSKSRSVSSIQLYRFAMYVHKSMRNAGRSAS